MGGSVEIKINGDVAWSTEAPGNAFRVWALADGVWCLFESADEKGSTFYRLERAKVEDMCRTLLALGI